MVNLHFQRSEKNNTERIANLHSNEDILVVQFDDELEHEFTDDNQQINAAFDGMYDDIYEVVLPTTLWGVHRDPNRKFIAFSEFDSNNMTISKLLHITDTLDMKAYLYNTEVHLTKRNDLSLDGLTDALTQLDEYRACEIIRSGVNLPNCEIVATDSVYCRSCAKIAPT